LRKTVSSRAKIAATPEALLACLADYKRAGVFIEGLERLTPTGRQTKGEGAQFEAVMKVGPRTLRTTTVIASLVPKRSITWSSTGDNGQSLSFELDPDQDETTVSLTIEYQEPGGIAGALIAPFVEQTVQHRADTALVRLKEHCSPA
jgi:carbon monoxide dehydrogenase subunit G